MNFDPGPLKVTQVGLTPLAMLSRRFCVLLLVGGFLSAGAAAGEKGEAAKPSFWGYVVLDAERTYVSVALPGQSVRWLLVGAEVDGYKISRLDIPGEKVVVVDRSGAEIALPMQVAKVKQVTQPKLPNNRVRLPMPPAGSVSRREPLPESEIVDIFPPKETVPRTDDLDWEWIDSPANPMRAMATVPSQEETRRWGSMPQADRDAVVELYRQGGWAITVFVKRNGLVAASYRKIKRPE